MRITIASIGKILESEVDQRFGRAAYFIIVDTETMDFSTFQNDRVAAEEEAGIGAAKAVAGAGVQSVLTGNCGTKAERILRDAGVRLYTGVTGTVLEAIELYRGGRLTEANGPNVQSHFGTDHEAKAGMSNGTNI
ncbi:MAG: NifB/NifX family molybdenum-iron cluster-binding protein [Phycisphaerae bacterium]|nr:NifB/NifX family molybdenum-iron cluster-binding protein [Phycisphaerae bacterium]